MSQTQALGLLKDGTAAARSGNKDLARRLLREATQLDPRNELTWLWLASVSDNPRDAVDCLEEVLDINPANPQAVAGVKSARLHAGIAAAKVQDKLAARRYLAQVTEEDPGSETAWMWLASVSETPQEAMGHLQRVLEINPANERARAGLQYYQSQVEPEKPPWECPLCGAADEPNEDQCPVCGAALSLAHVEPFFSGDGAEHEAMQNAIDRFSQALQEKPCFEGHYYTALAFLNSKRIAEAVPHLRSALQMKAGDQAFRSQVRAVLQRQATEEAAAKERAAKQKAKQVTILCIDDSATVRKLVGMTLENAGHRVITAGDGYEAVDVIRDRGVPDLILLDINMPGMDGYQLCKLLRHNEATAHLPIVMLSGKDGFFNKLRGRMAGSSEYITKPFQAEQLLRIVQKYCAAKVAANRPTPTRK